MPEAEDVLTDVARHATVYARRLWQRHRARGAPPVSPLTALAPRLDLLLAAVFGRRFPLRAAPVPLPPTLLTRLFQRGHGPRPRQALPATDGHQLWLPADAAPARLRLLALGQGMRAVRGSVERLPPATQPWARDLYLLLEAQAADHALAGLLPGLVDSLHALRRQALAERPPLTAFPPWRRPLEQAVRGLLTTDCRRAARGLPLTATPAASAAEAARLAATLTAALPPGLRRRAPLWRDLWSGELRPPEPVPAAAPLPAGQAEAGTAAPPRSARLTRRPEVRQAREEERTTPGAWMIQTSQPHEKAEDPIGMQRPSDRDAETAAEDFADAVSELPEARLVSTPGRPREVLLSDTPPPARARQVPPGAGGPGLPYPEWDYRLGAYREPGATVRLLPATLGPQAWVDATLAAQRPLLADIRRRFELLRARRQCLRRQREGEDIDLEAWTEAMADFHAGRPLAQNLYQTWRPARRDLAILLLIDSSGSTDGWVAAQRRVIDVAREALLLVCHALQGLGDDFAVLAFSGEGPQAVTVRTLKDFAEPYGNAVARRIAALAPEHYTRTGAALRHATGLLLRRQAGHRLLFLLSDGKPNDLDEYEGRYGVEDMRQAVTEARLQGLHPFCLTIDRQGAAYLPAVFGAHGYAVLTQPERLPLILVEWLRRLVSR